MIISINDMLQKQLKNIGEKRTIEIVRYQTKE